VTRRRLTLLLAAAAGLLSSAPAYAAVETTQPGSTQRVFVTLTDRGIRLTIFDELSTGGQTGLVPTRGGGTRGDVAIIRVHNTGKRKHNFAFLGKKTPPLEPGRTRSFAVMFLRRGSFSYESTLDRGKPGFRGVIVVR